MQKTILITGATDGIGLETAKMLLEQKHHVILHGRNASKLASVQQALQTQIDDMHGSDQTKPKAKIDSYIADFSDLSAVNTFAQKVLNEHANIDVLINNAGIYEAPKNTQNNALDLRFIVNALAPYLLTQQLLSALSKHARVVNLSSAAQAPVSIEALMGNEKLTDQLAYAQSKLALTMWSRQLGLALKDKGPMIVSVNPKSLLGSKMVQGNFGITGGALSIGAEILCQAALSEQFNDAHGLYYDNDIECFNSPHIDALDSNKTMSVVDTIELLLKDYSN